MKTIAPKDAFKLFLFLAILFSAKTFSQFPNTSQDSNPSECVTRMGEVKTSAATTDTESSACRAHAMSYNTDNALTGEVTSKFGTSE
jgi:hypothetical protein